MDNSVKERIKIFIEHKGMSIRAFERSCNLSNGYINSIEQTIMPNKMKTISLQYPELNTSWLLTGEGEMLKNNTPKEKTEAPAAPSYTTYLLPMSAMGGSLTGFAAPGAELKDCELVVSPIEDVDFAITISGESMAPEFPSGSRILIKKVDPGLFIEWGKAYVLDTPNGVIIKEVLRCAREGYVTCHSINPDPKFADFDVPLSEVYGMYRVLMCMAAK